MISIVEKPDVIYEYDGSFPGLLCCVFESYYKDEIPGAIFSARFRQMTFLPVRKVVTDFKKYRRVLESIPKKMGKSMLNIVIECFLTCMPQKELNILLFLRLGYSCGNSILHNFHDPVVGKVLKSVKHLHNESHLLEGFIRFSVFHGILVSRIAPENYVLPVIKSHFCSRYPEEHFIIHDTNHNMSIVYRPHEAVILPMENLQLPEPDEREKYFRSLWKLFYHTIEIKDRRNLKCRSNNMPKHYWKFMTEFGGE